MLFMVLCLVVSQSYEANLDESFRYEKLHNFGLGRRIIPNYRRIMNSYGYPEKLFSKKPVLYIRPPYRNVYQGIKRKGDRRVYNQKFSHKAEMSAFSMFAEAVLDCEITHLAVETDANIPIIYRGGAGYRFFMIVVKSEPGVEISAQAKAYCKNVTKEKK